jgi:hypothetical protein
MGDEPKVTYPAGPELGRDDLFDVLRRAMEAAGMGPGADPRDLPARVAYLRGRAEAQPRREPWADVPGSPPDPLQPAPDRAPGWQPPPTIG